MSIAPLNILILCDAEGDGEVLLQDVKHSTLEDWESEVDVFKTLRASGHNVNIFTLYQDIFALTNYIQTQKPDLVFNLCEAFGGDREKESNIPAMLELFKVPYTGAGPGSLERCKDKALSKKILAYHDVLVPKFVMVQKNLKQLSSVKYLSFPVIVKPLGLEASQGIAQSSVAPNFQDCVDRIRFVQERFQPEVIVEEFIGGREIYVGLMGCDQIKTFPPRELFFESAPQDDLKIATYRAKWDEKYRKRWGIKTGPACDLSESLLKEITQTCLMIYAALKIDGYARIDLRLTQNNECVFIEANPNPSIAREDDFAQSALSAGVDYEELLNQIILLALAEKRMF